MRPFTWLLVCSIVVVVNAAPRAHAQATQPSAPETAAAAESAQAPESAADATEPTELPAPAAAAGTAPQGLQQVELRLRAAREERAQASRLLPWLTLGLGATSMVVAATAGSIQALTCDTGCDTPNWVAFTVVAGAAVTTIGAIWVVHRDADIRELDSHVYHLEQELERVRLSRAFRDRSSQRSLAYLSWRLRW